MLLYRAKKYGPGWVGEWMDGRAGLRIAYSNKKDCHQDWNCSLLLTVPKASVLLTDIYIYLRNTVNKIRKNAVSIQNTHYGVNKF